MVMLLVFTVDDQTVVSEISPATAIVKLVNLRHRNQRVTNSVWKLNYD